MLRPAASDAASLRPTPAEVARRHRGDEIRSVPGFKGTLPTRHYAGYITVDEERGRHLYYYFVQSQHKPSKDPVVLWLNGGPGCSSLGGEWWRRQPCTAIHLSCHPPDQLRCTCLPPAAHRLLCLWAAGFVNEHGPFSFSFKGGKDAKGRHEQQLELGLNPHSWNQVANMLYVDSPAGVGMSYAGECVELLGGSRMPWCGPAAILSWPEGLYADPPVQAAGWKAVPSACSSHMCQVLWPSDPPLPPSLRVWCVCRDQS